MPEVFMEKRVAATDYMPIEETVREESPNLLAFFLAEARLEKLREYFGQLGKTTAEINVETDKEKLNQDRIDQLNIRAHQILSTLEASLAQFPATVESQYPKVSFLRRCLMYWAFLLRALRESTYVAISQNKEKRKILLETLGEMCTLTEEYKVGLTDALDKAEEAKWRPWKPQQQLLLVHNDDYQTLIQKLVERQKDFELIKETEGSDTYRGLIKKLFAKWLHEVSFPENFKGFKIYSGYCQVFAFLQNEITSLKTEKKRIEKEALYLAMAKPE